MYFTGTQTDADTSGIEDTPEDEDMEIGHEEEPNEEQERDNDPSWIPEETDAYIKTGDDDDSEKSAKPR